MKKLIVPVSLLAAIITSGQTHSLVKLWETDTIVAIPESVLPDPGKGILYISLINGGGWDADGKGGVAKLGLDGKNYDSSWVTGLNAPKGLGTHDKKIYAANINEVVVIDMKDGKIKKKIAIEGATGLNDITVDKKGIIYVSDSRKARIWRIEKDIPTLFLDSIKGVNGLKAIGDDLYIGAGKNFIKADNNKVITKIIELPQAIDGIEPAANGDFILTSWGGYIFYVTTGGTLETLLDSHNEKMNTADIGYDPTKRILYVPTFNAKKIVAYRLRITVPSQSPKTFLIDAGHLLEVKNKLGQNDRTAVRLIDSLKKEANDLLKMKPVSVMDKPTIPPSGSKHDYMSQAPYFWYDSSKPNGLPYLRRDGERNPEIYKITDHKYFDNVSSAARSLSLAYYFTGDEKYAVKAAELLRYWFFNEATKMNPHLEYAQAVPGVNTGRGTGIIESRSLTGIADAAVLLQGSRAWTNADNKQLQQWYSQFLDWLLNSNNGKYEHAAKNNHGTWFYVQAIDFALFTGNNEKVKQLVEEAKKRLDSQLTAEGKWPLELERTNALGYSTFNTRAWFDLATLAEINAVDLWHYKNKNGATLQTAIDWLAPYALDEKKWEYKQISPYNKNDIYPLLLKAAEKFNTPSYLEKARSLNKNGSEWMTELLFKD